MCHASFMLVVSLLACMSAISIFGDRQDVHVRLDDATANLKMFYVYNTPEVNAISNIKCSKTQYRHHADRLLMESFR